MTRQVTEGSPITITFRSRATGSFVTDHPVTIDGGQVYTTADRSATHDSPTVGGDGSFTFYGEPGVTYTISVDNPDVNDVEPVQVVPTALRPSGQVGVAEHTIPENVSEQVSDASLVGAPASSEGEGGALAQVGAAEAAVIPPGDPAPGTPDGTTATDPAAAVAPAAPGETSPVPAAEPAPVESAAPPADPFDAEVER